MEPTEVSNDLTPEEEEAITKLPPTDVIPVSATERTMPPLPTGP